MWEVLVAVILGLATLGVAWWRWRTPHDPAWRITGTALRTRESGIDKADRGIRSVLLAACGALLVAGALWRALTSLL